MRGSSQPATKNKKKRKRRWCCCSKRQRQETGFIWIIINISDLGALFTHRGVQGWNENANTFKEKKKKATTRWDSKKEAVKYWHWLPAALLWFTSLILCTRDPGVRGGGVVPPLHPPPQPHQPGGDQRQAGFHEDRQGGSQGKRVGGFLQRSK